MGLGERARSGKRIQEALTYFEQATRVSPTRTAGWQGLGYTYLAIGEYEKAVEFFDRALDLAPDNSRCLFGCAVALLHLGRSDAALELANRIHDLHGVDNQIHYHTLAGRIFMDKGSYEEAAEHIEQRIALSEQIHQGYERIREDRFRLAEIYIELNRPADAVRTLESLIASKWMRSVQDQIGRLYLQLERYREAEEAFERILRDFPTDVRALVGVGQAYLARHKHDDAIRVFATALTVEPNNLAALDGLAEGHKNKGDLGRAAEFLERARQTYKVPEALIQRRLKRIEEERARRDAELLRIRNIASLNVMATGIAHELRQPLSVIRLAAQNARRDLSSGKVDHVVDDLKDIDEHIGRIDRVISLLRDMGGTGRVDRAPKFVPVSLRTVVDRSLDLFREQLVSRGIDLEVDHIDHTVLGDADALVQIVVNLISNARDALTSAKKKTIRVWAVQTADRVHLFVSDTGEGMSADVRRQCFDPFFTTKKEAGVGVGLYIAHNLARQMDGHLTIRESRPGRGTTFEFSLKASLPEHEE